MRFVVELRLVHRQPPLLFEQVLPEPKHDKLRIASQGCQLKNSQERVSNLCARFVVELRLVYRELPLLFEDCQLSLLLLSLVRLSVLQDSGFSLAFRCRAFSAHVFSQVQINESCMEV